MVAGVTAAAVALPVGMAVGINSGFPPETGIYSAIFASLCGSLLGGSRFQIGGPSAAFVFFSASIVKQYGWPGLQMVTLMAGFILIFLGLTKLGATVKLLPASTLIGFANGIAILIAVKQVGLVLGWGTMGTPGETLPLLLRLAEHPSSANPVSCVLAAGSLIVILLAPKMTKRLPGSLIALVIAAGAVWFFGAPVETIGSRFGGMPSGLPVFTIPLFRAELIAPLVIPAFAAAILISVESLLAAAVTDTVSGDRHSSGTELIGQGVSNLLVPMFGGIPAAGAVARTVVNSRSGANTPLAGLVHVLALCSVLVFAAPLTRFVPLATLAAIMLVLAFNLSLWREVRLILRLDLTARISWLIVVVLTVCAGLTVAVEAMLALAVLHYVRRASLASGAVPQVTSDETIGGGILDMATVLSSAREDGDCRHKPMGWRCARLEKLAPIVIVSVEDITNSDLPGLEEFCDLLKGSGRILLICGISRQSAILRRYPKFIERIGKRNVLPHLPAALKRASDISDRFLGVGERLAGSLAQAPL
ncbi:SulP family inorganic anion transporter [uncultured Paludibaculum sp.]|uniref:SulP family inorganic anion transporter n=1 Tax=uncultured Paludibaculum sp. TaxID=1765020 RepID=UPI002AAAB68C|nr:SulP family inorganic anion transporter [uncultured Paludibaculum sp.]